MLVATANIPPVGLPAPDIMAPMVPGLPTAVPDALRPLKPGKSEHDNETGTGPCAAGQVLKAPLRITTDPRLSAWATSCALPKTTMKSRALAKCLLMAGLQSKFQLTEKP